MKYYEVNVKRRRMMWRKGEEEEEGRKGRKGRERDRGRGG